MSLQLTGCTPTPLSCTGGTGCIGSSLSASAFGLTFYDGKAYIADVANSVVVICTDADTLTGCKRFHACSGTTSPSTDGGCASSDNTIATPVRLEFLPLMP